MLPSGIDALDARLIQAMCETPRAGVMELARQAASNAEMSNYAIIHALPRIADMSAADGLFVESFVSAFTAHSPEAEARLNAFLDKRAAKVAQPGAAR